jgi:hypothetical protein
MTVCCNRSRDYSVLISTAAFNGRFSDEPGKKEGEIVVKLTQGRSRPRQVLSTQMSFQPEQTRQSDHPHQPGDPRLSEHLLHSPTSEGDPFDVDMRTMTEEDIELERLFL